MALMTSSVPPLAGDVGAESHWQQGDWFAQQHAAARFFIRAAVYSMGIIPQSNGPSPDGLLGAR
jgi:hypothetical protein